MNTEQKVKIRLIELGMTQTILGRKLGCGVNRVNDAIMGRPEGKKHWPKIAEFLGIPVDQSPYFNDEHSV